MKPDETRYIQAVRVLWDDTGKKWVADAWTDHGYIRCTVNGFEAEPEAALDEAFALLKAKGYSLDSESRWVEIPV